MEVSSHEPVAPPVASARGIKQLLSNRSRTSLHEPGSDNASSLAPRKSTDFTRDDGRNGLSRNSSRDDSSKSGSSGIRKLIPGLSKRKRRRMREAAGLLQPESESTDSNPRLSNAKSPPELVRSHSSTSLLQDDNSSLLTDDSEPSSARPPLANHDSHAGFLTYSSPLINTTAVDESTSSPMPQTQSMQPSKEAIRSPTFSAANIPTITHSPSLPVTEAEPLVSSPVFGDRANTLGLSSESLASRRKSLSTAIRGISPGRKLKEAFQPGRSNRSPRVSPERNSGRGETMEVQQAEDTTAESPQTAKARSPAPAPIIGGINAGESSRTTTSSPVLASIRTDERPQTPPSGRPDTPLTTVTPPTPVDSRAPIPASPTRTTEHPTAAYGASNRTANPSGNLISHRRVRSESGSLHQPSKLSNAISAPLTPTIEEAKTPSANSEARNITQGSGFFSSWVSAAQTAASTITNTLNSPNKARVGNESPEPEKHTPGEPHSNSKVEVTADPIPSKRERAVDTLGTGELKLSHLGFGSDSKESLAQKSDSMEGRKEFTIRRDEAAAKIEDMLAKRAVSAAYAKPSEDHSKTPVAESDPVNSLRQSSTFNSNLSSDVQTTPNGSIFEGDAASVKRNNSVRSRLKERRKRGSSNATGTSTVGTLLVASASSLANPAAGPKLTGFAVAPKARNRTFHQLFRSVPEDDFLIEDYSCALQKEILLAGRIYISEGHICFSSNILGWVTTLVISFEELVAIERETTAMVFPNAIAIQTLHARHIFRSLLSREATFDLMVGIWKQSHPAAFKKSVNGRQQAGDETTQQVVKPAESDSGSDEESEEDDEVYDEDEEVEGAGSFVDAGSFAGSDMTDVAGFGVRKASGIQAPIGAAAAPYPPVAGDGQAAEKAIAAASAATVDFPGPATHGPTECTDSATHYDKILKDESIPAPLGKIYSMLFGPTSGVFLTKYLVDEQKVTELQYEDDKKGLGEQNRTRSYSYIKPLYASIGPRQTKCITSENLDAFDLEKSVSVTCTTQTPDVPSGNVFSVKTRYCLSWAAGNATRLQMNCTVEWTGKSWLKGPIEKGATDGQQTYGNDLVKALKAAVSSRPRAATTGSKGPKGARRKKRGEKSSAILPKSQAASREEEHWGLFEPLRGILGPVVGIFKPFAGVLAVATIITLLGIIFFTRPVRGPPGRVGYPGFPASARLAAYEEIWQKEESELWSWLEDRAGIEGLAFKEAPGRKGKSSAGQSLKSKSKERQKVLSSRDAEARLRREQMSAREMEDAIRITQERLDVLKGVLEKKKLGQQGGGAQGDAN